MTTHQLRLHLLPLVLLLMYRLLHLLRLLRLPLLPLLRLYNTKARQASILAPQRKRKAVVVFKRSQLTKTTAIASRL
jgi:hypothetical protein